jgi:hypothetical protein
VYTRNQIVTIKAGTSTSPTTATRRQFGIGRGVYHLILTAVVWLALAVPAASQTGTLMPVPQQVFLDASGNPLNGGLVYTYIAGTTTPLSTYSDLALSVPNTNPIVLNSAGRNAAGGIYLSAANYKIIVKTSAGATIYTQDNVGATPPTVAVSSFNDLCNVRLTLTSGAPVTASDVTAATVVYVSPYRGNRCATYDGSAWNITTFTELSISLGADAANTNYDVFFYVSSSVATVERVAWTNDTTRATALVKQDGVYVKSGSTTKRYLGTYRTTGTVGQCEDSKAKRFTWNYYNRVRKDVRAVDATDTWTYTTDTWRQVRASTANQVAVVVGVAEDTIDLTAMSLAANTNAGVILYAGIGVNATTAPSTAGQPARVDAPAANAVVVVPAALLTVPNEGYTFYAWLERSAATGTTTWLGDNGDNQKQQSGIFGTWLC